MNTHKITSGKELEDYILKEYSKYDVELSSLFFDVEVCMKESEILKAYANIQRIINGDSVIRYKDITTDNEGNIVGGDEAEDFIPEEKYDSVYDGNCKDFLESFNGKELETGFCRYDEDNLLSFIW